MSAASQPPQIDTVLSGVTDLDHTLFVIFHGAIAFYDDPKLTWIDSFLADLKDDHVYVAGTFLGEARVPARSHLALSGVTPGVSSFDEYKSDYIHYTGNGNAGALVHLDQVYSRIVFPRPDRILHALNFARPDGSDRRKLCIVPVFQYRFESVDNLRLRMFLDYGLSCAPQPEVTARAAMRGSRSDSFNWKPVECDPTPLTLHIRAEEDREPGMPDRDHDAALQILDDNSNNDITAFTTFDRGDALPGFTPERTFWEIDLSLRKRVQWLTSVGSKIQRHPPAPDTAFVVHAPRPFNDQTDDDPSCGIASGGPKR